MKLTTPMQITAADSDSRTITGRIVAFNEQANASTGKVVFARGSIVPQDVFLNLEHDITRRIGKSISMAVNDKEMTATFKIANTTAGTDALVEAMDGLRDGFSIELAVENYEMQKDGTMKVISGQLKGVALVTEPAVRSARVSEVAASEDSETHEVSDTTNPNEGDKVENTTEQAAPAVEPVAAPTVEPVQASRPVHYTAPRSPITNKVSYLEHYLKATILHDEDSRQYVKAADNTTSTAPGMIPTPQSTQIVNALANADRGMIDALSRETLVGEGMTFEIPRVTAVPTVANVAENAAVTDSSLSATFLSVPVQSFKGRAISTVELIDRSRPEYLTALLQNLEFAYAKVTDEFAVGTIAGSWSADWRQCKHSDRILGIHISRRWRCLFIITGICSQHCCFTRTMDKHHGLQRQWSTAIQRSAAKQRGGKCQSRFIARRSFARLKSVCVSFNWQRWSNNIHRRFLHGCY
jgi:phage head maturation protease